MNREEALREWFWHDSFVVQGKEERITTIYFGLLQKRQFKRMIIIWYLL